MGANEGRDDRHDSRTISSSKVVAVCPERLAVWCSHYRTRDMTVTHMPALQRPTESRQLLQAVDRACNPAMRAAFRQTGVATHTHDCSRQRETDGEAIEQCPMEAHRKPRTDPFSPARGESPCDKNKTNKQPAQRRAQ